MTWDDIRTHHPDRWVLVEALNAYTDGAYRIIPNLAVLGEYIDYYAGWDDFKRLHESDKWREYYVLHTSRPKLEIGILDTFRRVVTP